jgi:hypothetical protein
MITQEITLTIETINEEKYFLDFVFENKNDISFDDALYRFINSDADCFKITSPEETVLMTKDFLKNKIITITINTEKND